MNFLRLILFLNGTNNATCFRLQQYFISYFAPCLSFEQMIGFFVTSCHWHEFSKVTIEPIKAFDCFMSFVLLLTIFKTKLFIQTYMIGRLHTTFSFLRDMWYWMHHLLCDEWRCNWQLLSSEDFGPSCLQKDFLLNLPCLRNIENNVW